MNLKTDNIFELWLRGHSGQMAVCFRPSPVSRLGRCRDNKWILIQWKILIAMYVIITTATVKANDSQNSRFSFLVNPARGLYGGGILILRKIL